MKKSVKLLSLILSLVFTVGAFSSCSKAIESTPVKLEDFRVTAYIIEGDILDKNFDKSNLDNVTDIILFSSATFDKDGNVKLSDNISKALTKLALSLNGKDKNIYLNILGPDANTDSDDWNKQMESKAELHNAAFKTGKLQNNIKNVLDEYKFDGIFFDYEFPMKSKNWKTYSEFIVSLDETLGDDYKIGMALAAWDAKLSNEAKKDTDFIELMSYDLWDDDGNHATIDIATDDIDSMVKQGYDKAKIDLGLPFYARPTTEEAYWYNYKDYADKIDENGLYDDKELNLTFSFNTPEVISEKTSYAISEGLGGVMVWHYSCDLPSNNKKSLFKAVRSSIEEASKNASK